ncbi:hypothetical protein [Pseudarthrobacter sp. S9]|uniref:hypothetical protein n=1 Tax=Pseudarthrobacter sp. S9 TaxID=3418421 RepID=UPI003D0822CE
MREPIQHPISQLGFFTEYTGSWLVEVSEAAASLEEARKKPHVLTDNDVAQVRRGYTKQADDLVLFEDTAARWAAQTNLTAEQRAGLDVLEGNLARLRKLNTSAQELVAYLEPRTIDRVLATPDIELGFNTLLKYLADENPKPTP